MCDSRAEVAASEELKLMMIDELFKPNCTTYSELIDQLSLFITYKASVM